GLGIQTRADLDANLALDAHAVLAVQVQGIGFDDRFRSRHVDGAARTLDGGATGSVEQGTAEHDVAETGDRGVTGVVADELHRDLVVCLHAEAMTFDSPPSPGFTLPGTGFHTDTQHPGCATRPVLAGVAVFVA